MSIAQQTDFRTEVLERSDLYLAPECIEVASSLELVDRERAIGSHVVRDICDIQIDRFRFSDGSQYDVQLIEPVKKVSDIVLTYTTPWLTRLGGLNTYLGIEAAKSGMSSVAVSAEVASFGKAIKNIGHVTLAHEALVQHLALDEVELDGRFMAGMAILAGYSRGAMVGFGVNGEDLAAQFGRQIVYSDLIDPCLEHKPGLTAWNPKELAPYCEVEIIELIKCITHYQQKEAWHMLKTLPTSISQFIQEIATGCALFSGEAGDLGDIMPEDSPMYLTLYIGSLFNQSASWREKFSERFKKICINNETGTHITGSDMGVIRETVGRISIVQQLLKDGATRADIDPTQPNFLVAA